MVYQSNIRHQDGEKAKVVEIKKGVYAISNAYEGSYEYFKPKGHTERPLEEEQQADISPEPETLTSHE